MGEGKTCLRKYGANLFQGGRRRFNADSNF